MDEYSSVPFVNNSGDSFIFAVGLLSGGVSVDMVKQAEFEEVRRRAVWLYVPFVKLFFVVEGQWRRKLRYQNDTAIRLIHFKLSPNY